MFTPTRTLCRNAPTFNWQVYIFTGDDLTAEQLSERAATLFGVPPLRPVRTVRLLLRGLVLARLYPVFTLLGQSLGSMALALETLYKLTPALFVDTAGYAFAYPLASAAGSKVASYTHYPMVSTDMLAVVSNRAETFNNRAWVARSTMLSAVKASYYRLLASLYGSAGRCADVIMVNSSWTEGHIAEMWRVRPSIVYPPCDIESLKALPLDRPAMPRIVISVAQFRPEKAHAQQLRAWAAVMQRAAASEFAGRHAYLRGAKLVLVGGVRHAEDRERLDGLRAMAERLGIASDVDFQTGIPAVQLRLLLASAHAGLHTMRDEHFGISVVEYMAAGAVPIAHRSAGPAMDIVVPEAPGEPLPGRLCTSDNEYADALEEVLCMPEEERLGLAKLARDASEEFTELQFTSDFVGALARVLPRSAVRRVSTKEE